MDRNYSGPCPECCEPCAPFRNRATITLVLSGISFCVCTPYFGDWSTYSGTINGTFTLTATGPYSWALTVPSGMTYFDYTDAACTIPATGPFEPTGPLDVQMEVSCSGGTFTVSIIASDQAPQTDVQPAFLGTGAVGSAILNTLSCSTAAVSATGGSATVS